MREVFAAENIFFNGAGTEAKGTGRKRPKNFSQQRQKRLHFVLRCDIISTLIFRGLVVKRLRRRPLTAQSRVRFPARSPHQNNPNLGTYPKSGLFFTRDYFGLIIRFE